VPFGLWVRGSGELRTAVDRWVAIVGARASTDYGDHVSGDLAAGCVAQGWSVVSGGAYGIDAAAHRGALAAE
jgi:DNA processing protein